MSNEEDVSLIQGDEESLVLKNKRHPIINARMIDQATNEINDEINGQYQEIKSLETFEKQIDTLTAVNEKRRSDIARVKDKMTWLNSQL